MQPHSAVQDLCRRDRKDGGERRTFAEKSEAETFAKQQRIRRRNEGSSAFALKAADRIDAERALQLLKPHGRTLREAADFFVKHLPVIKSEITVAALVEEILPAKERDGVSIRYLKDLRTRLNIFAAAFPNEKMTEFSTARIDDWLRALPHGAVTRNDYRRLLGVLFSYAMKRGYCLTNPAKGASKAKNVAKPPGILTAAQAAGLLANAEPEILPAIALGLFAGLRPESEVWRLDWSHIDLETGLIDVAADRTKSARNRWVKISPNLIEWLLPHQQRAGAVAPTGDKYNYMLRRARAAAGIKKWPHDALRHTFASMHFANFKNIADTASELGHTNVKTLLDHYRERVKPAEAAKYWGIKPDANQAGGKMVVVV